MDNATSVCCIVVHFGDYTNTRNCINSLLASSYPVSIIVCDNASNVSESELKSDYNHIQFFKQVPIEVEIRRQGILWCQMLSNLGYAAAANRGIQIAINNSDAVFLMILNNDCTTQLHCIQQLLTTYVSINDCGILGAKVLFSGTRSAINSVGGYFNKWTAWQRNIGAFETDSGQYPLLFKPSYVYGACMFFSKRFITTVGLMDESFLLYQEEHDWCIRAEKSGFTNYTCTQAVVYHLQGASSGKKIKMQDAPDHVLILQYGNLIRLYTKHFPILLPIAYIRLAMIFIKRLIQGKARHAFLVLRVIFGKRINSL